ncbi:MAG: hypothetical protein A2Y25_02110 [Candidatus Melainabacteria bacterium GWF2_37_15]|nr:MAG: hypothetical protein A2Y25_02110 [Candidatus Melainabacteria bacterium GWF2_37_15]
MKENKYPHLIIPEGDVEKVVHEPTGRTKVVPRDHLAHGQLLLDGFKAISDYHIVHESSLGEDVLVFKVKLHEGHTFQDKKKQEFLSNNKIKVNALRDNQTAIVSSEVKELSTFKNKLENYTKYKQNQDFQYIDEITPDSNFDKQSFELKEILSEEELPKEDFDVQMMLIPGLDKPLYEKTLKNLEKKIKSINGNIIREAYYLSDGTPIIRAKISPSKINYLSSDEALFRIEKTNFFEFAPSQIKLTDLSDVTLDEKVDTNSLHSVVVIDSGVDFSKISILAPLVKERYLPEGVKVFDPSHGTAVASRVLFGDEIDKQIKLGKLSPYATIIDACVFDEKALSEDILITRIKDIVEKYHAKAKVFN